MHPKTTIDYNAYDTYFIDLVGVIYDGVTFYPKALHAIEALQQKGKELVFVSNNPRPSSLSEKNLLRHGIKKPFKIVTSGDYTRHLIQTDYKNSKIFQFGAEKNKDLLYGLNCQVVDSVKKCDVVLLSYFIDEQDSKEDLNPLLDEIAASQKKVLCANPDIYALHGKTIRKCSGYFAALLKKRGAKVTYLGKPEKSFYEFVVNTAVKETFDLKKK